MHCSTHVLPVGCPWGEIGEDEMMVTMVWDNGAWIRSIQRFVVPWTDLDEARFKFKARSLLPEQPDICEISFLPGLTPPGWTTSMGKWMV